ncbi:hypothetical protein K466DRAFT_64507 [Polyporus arcularius HHB13444]|uniref:Uncharacterized protein n=1 Tax=Polyporus arcularius HHB13444 TaxID=1314778 RepID=A0A5C3PFU5_9APHY|nr:hypothetical protein K466DRAFT_64507 [Polyporus arcularius HHB13444]
MIDRTLAAFYVCSVVCAICASGHHRCVESRGECALGSITCRSANGNVSSAYRLLNRAPTLFQLCVEASDLSSKPRPSLPVVLRRTDTRVPDRAWPRSSISHSSRWDFLVEDDRRVHAMAHMHIWSTSPTLTCVPIARSKFFLRSGHVHQVPPFGHPRAIHATREIASEFARTSRTPGTSRVTHAALLPTLQPEILPPSPR